MRGFVLLFASLALCGGCEGLPDTPPRLAPGDRVRYEERELIVILASTSKKDCDTFTAINRDGETVTVRDSTEVDLIERARWDQMPSAEIELP